MFMFSGVIQAQEVHIKHENKHLLANLEMADGKSIEDGIVLMTHGTTAHGRMEIMAGLQSVLKESGINSISITLSLNEDKRQGMYECSNTHRHKHSNAVKEIGLWLKWLKTKGATNVTLLGHSRGGNQTAWFAAQSNDPVVKHVVLIAPAYLPYELKKSDYQKNYQKDLDTVLQKANALVKSGKGDTIMTVDFIYCKDAKVTAASFADYYNDNPNHNTPDLIKKIKVPVLIIAGSNDTSVKDVAKVYAPALKEGDKIVTVEGADHFFRDLYAYDIVDAMTAFMGN
jgi:predicted alpha/beta-hydrolase family hydrolase